MPAYMKHLYIIGGGAAGFFAAIRHKSLYPQHTVCILEKHSQLLSKVKISGGGRCNLTHDCLHIPDLLKHYPRGNRELNGPFHRFGPLQTMQWFEERGVRLKTEADKRVFPISDDSQTIIDCLMTQARQLGVEILTRKNVVNLAPAGENWQIGCADGSSYVADWVLLATGGTPAVWEMLADMGHTIIPPVPSLFTFHLQSPLFGDLSGISVEEVKLRLADSKLATNGGLLLTHTGLSGPAVLRLSAWAARQLHEKNYLFDLGIQWVTAKNREEVRAQLQTFKEQFPQRQIGTHNPFGLAARLWKRLLELAETDSMTTLNQLSNKHLANLSEVLFQTNCRVRGKSPNKEEFVTCGGVSLREVDFKTMQSRRARGLYFAGECLDIDALTGGFNFQAAWTTGWIAGEGIGLEDVPASI